MIYTAIDIGSSRIKAVSGSFYKNHELVIISAAQIKSTGIKRGIVLNVQNTAMEIQRVLEKTEESTGHKVSNIICNINGQHIQYNTEPTSGMVPLPNFPLVHIQEAVLSNIIRCFEQSQIEIDYLIPNAIAACYSVLSNEEITEGTLLIDIGSQTFGITLVFDGKMKHIEVLSNLASNLKIENRLAEIIQTNHKTVKNIVVTGGFFGNGIYVQFLAEKLKIPYRVGYPYKIKDVVSDNVTHPAFASVLGMIQRRHLKDIVS